MSVNSKISWTEATWNPIAGCDRVSPGCDACYAIREANRHQRLPAYAGTVHRTENGLDWTGKVNLLPERLTQPLSWRKPKLIFVNSMSDLFHEQVPDRYIARVFGVMADAPQHTFQILTKRHGRMRSLLNRTDFQKMMAAEILNLGLFTDPDMVYDSVLTAPWPLSNAWIGVSVEDQKWADIRIPALLDTPAAVRWISAEPLLGPLDVAQYLPEGCHLSWVVAGGESGPHARPMHPRWARGLRDQCVAAGVPFHFKQWGEWGPAPWRVEREPGETDDAYKARSEATCATHSYAMWADQYDHFTIKADHKPWSAERGGLVGDTHAPIRKWGKHTAGRELDGKVWDQYPSPAELAVAHG